MSPGRDLFSEGFLVTVVSDRGWSKGLHSLGWEWMPCHIYMAEA